MYTTRAKYHLGQVVRHRKHPFRGVVFDVDPEFSNTEEWYESLPEESRPSKEQPFYHLLAENDQSYYVAYVSEQNLIADYSGEPVGHPDIPDLFGPFEDGHYPLHFQLNCPGGGLHPPYGRGRRRVAVGPPRRNISAGGFTPTLQSPDVQGGHKAPTRRHP